MLYGLFQIIFPARNLGIALLVTAFCAPPAALLAHHDPNDNSRADADGPFVFYRGPQVVVKSLQRRDTSTVVITDVFPDKKSARLTCTVPATGDRFSFHLQDNLVVPADEYPMPARMLVLSDIEGNFEAFKTMLLAAGVINRQFQWTFGEGHIVLLGDYFDRGLNVTECLWLTYKLESEARAAGGQVHFILGNHEILNLQGDTRYVRRKYFENARLLGEDYRRWYASDTELGRWLRTKNAIERIGDHVFCHGGISPEMARSGLSLADINRLARRYLGFDEEAIPDLFARMVFDTRTGVFWYRGAVRGELSDAQMTEVLAYAGARRMVVGHTLVNDVTALYGGRLLCVDIYHDENIRLGFSKTLWIENGFAYVLDSRGMKSTIFTAAYSGKTD